MWNIISNFAEKIVGAIAGTIYYLESKKHEKKTSSKKPVYKG